MKVKQKDILNILKPYSMEIITPDNVSKVIKIDEFLSVCILRYRQKTGALNIKYRVEYSNRKKESEA